MLIKAKQQLEKILKYLLDFFEEIEYGCDRNVDMVGERPIRINSDFKTKI